MGKERLKLVTAWSELRAGMIVVLKHCRLCNGTHRGILLGQCQGRDEGKLWPGWEYVPPSDCVTGTAWFSVDAVSDRRLYRVLDGLSDSTDTTEQVKPREKERVR